LNIPTPFPNRDIMQMCWVVPDLESAIDGWVSSMGVGPFFWFAEVPFTEGRHRERPAEFPDVTAAIAYAGDIQIELVQQDDDQPGVFRDLFPQGTGGLHHVAVVCDDYDRDRDAYLAAGVELAFEGFAGPSRTSWVDTSPTLGFMVELLERSDMRDGFFAHMKKAAQRWDGTEPIVGRT